MKKNENILQRLHTKEAKAGIRRTGVDGLAGKAAKAVYIISFIYAMIMHLLYIFGMLLQLSAQTGNLNNAKNGSILVVSLTICLTAGFILLLKRKFTTALCLSALPSVILIITFAQQMQYTISEGRIAPFIIRHLIPLSLIIVSAAVYCIIGIHFTISENRAYTAFVDRLYSEHSSNFENLTDGEWEEFLKEYEAPRTKKQKRKEERS